jgi:tetratricopeptide (TPR) repeat protein
MGRLSKAFEDAQTGFEDAERIGEHRLAIWLRGMLAQIQIDLDMDEDAELNIRQGIKEADEIDQVILQCWTRAAFQKLLIKRSDWHTAIKVSREVKEVYTPTENLMGRSYVGNFTPLAYLGAGRIEDAQEALDEQLHLLRDKAIPHYHAIAFRNQGLILAELGKLAGAAQAFDQAMDTQESIKSWLELGRTYFQRSILRTKLGQENDAQEDIQSAIKLFEQCGAVYDLDLANRLLVL